MSINEKYIFLILCAIYIFLILLSIILYSIFKYCIFENKNSEKCNFKCNKYCCICKIFFKIVNCTFYLENIEVKNSKKTKNCKLCGETIQNYCSNVCANSIGLICPNKIKEFKCKCCNCCEYNEEDYDKDTQYFCYCYQEKGFCEWLDKFITNDIQKEIIPSMVLYFLSRLVTIASEEDFNNKKDNLEQGKFISDFILTFFLYFSLIIFNRAIIENNICYCNLENIFYKVLKSIYHEPFYILTFISCFGFIDSLEYFKNYDSTYIYPTIILNKIYFFSFNYYCTSVSENNGKNELLTSQSTLITIYIFIINMIVYLLKYLVSKNLKTLFIMQLVFSSIILFLLSIIYLWFILSILFFVLEKCNCCICNEGNFICKCYCCDKDSLKCKCCYCQYCDKCCTFNKIPKIFNKCFGKAIM